MYARQTIEAKALMAKYDFDELYKVLIYISEHASDYNIRSLAYVPYIFDDVMKCIGKEEAKKEIVLDESVSETLNSTKSSRFGVRKEEWSDIFVNKS